MISLTDHHDLENTQDVCREAPKSKTGPLVMIEKRTNSSDESDSSNQTLVYHQMDGGSTAWLQVLASWLLYANTWYNDFSNSTARLILNQGLDQFLWCLPDVLQHRAIDFVNPFGDILDWISADLPDDGHRLICRNCA